MTDDPNRLRRPTPRPPRQSFEPSPADLELMRELGVDPSTVVYGSLHIDWNTGDEQASVRWRGAAVITPERFEAYLREKGREAASTPLPQLGVPKDQWPRISTRHGGSETP